MTSTFQIQLISLENPWKKCPVFLKIKWGRNGHWCYNPLVTQEFQYSENIPLNVTFSLSSEVNVDLDRLSIDILERGWFQDTEIGSVNIMFNKLYDRAINNFEAPLVCQRKVTCTKLYISVTPKFAVKPKHQTLDPHTSMVPSQNVSTSMVNSSIPMVNSSTPMVNPNMNTSSYSNERSGIPQYKMDYSEDSVYTEMAYEKTQSKNTWALGKESNNVSMHSVEQKSVYQSVPYKDVVYAPPKKTVFEKGLEPPVYAQNPPKYSQNPPMYSQNPPTYSQNPPMYSQEPPKYQETPHVYINNLKEQKPQSFENGQYQPQPYQPPRVEKTKNLDHGPYSLA